MRRGALLLPLLVLGAASRAGFSLQDVLPDTTLFFAETPSAADFRAAFKKTPLYAFFRDDEVRSFGESALDGLLKDFDGLRKELEKELGVTWDQVWEIPGGQIALAVPTLAQEGDKQPDVVLSFDCPGRRETLLKIPPLVRRHSEKAGRKTQAWKAGDDPVLSGAFDPGFRWHLAVLGDALVVTTWKGRMEQIAAARKNGEPRPLSKSETLKRAREKAGAKEVFLFADLARFVKEVEERLGDDERRFVRALGLQGFTYAAGGLSVGDRFVTERFFLATAGERKGLAKFLSLKGAAPGFDAPPRDALAFVSFSIDVAELYATVLEVLKSADEIGQQRLLDRIDAFEREAGISLKNDLFAAFGPRVWAYSALPREGLLPDGVTCFEVKDAERFDKCLKAALKNLAADLGEIDFRGKKIHYLAFRRPAPFDEVRMFLSTIYFLRDGDRLFVSSPASLSPGYGAANALKRHVLRSEQPRLAAAPAVRDWLGGKSDDASLVLYLDLERALTAATNTFAPLLSMFKEPIRSAGVRADLMRLPLGETVGRSLGQSVHLVRVEPDGLRAEGFSGSGTSVTTIAFAGAAAVVLYPAVLKSLDSSKTSRCLSNCYSVHFAAVRHQGEKQKFPDKTGPEFLKQLKDLSYLSEDVACPHAGAAAYRGPVKPMQEMGDRDVIFCDEPGNHPDGSINVVRKDGTIETLRRDHPDYEKALKSTKGNH